MKSLTGPAGATRYGCGLDCIDLPMQHNTVWMKRGENFATLSKRIGGLDG